MIATSVLPVAMSKSKQFQLPLYSQHGRGSQNPGLRGVFRDAITGRSRALAVPSRHVDPRPFQLYDHDLTLDVYQRL